MKERVSAHDSTSTIEDPTSKTINPDLQKMLEVRKIERMNNSFSKKDTYQIKMTKNAIRVMNYIDKIDKG